MKKILFASAFSVALILQGCATDGASPFANLGKYETGTLVSDATMASFQDHRSTKAQVVAAIGHPDDQKMVGNDELWSYGYTKISSFGGNVSETTTFEFDRKGVLVTHYKSHGNANSSGNPLLKASGL